jgi:hypothetical protein
MPQTYVAPPGTTVIQQNGGTPVNTQPNATSPPADTTFRANRPTEPTPATPPQPTPGANDPYGVKKDNSTYLQPPALFSPNDRTAQRVMAPVHTALYQQPASYHSISTAPIKITAEQAAKDAEGWSSSAN